MFLEEYTYTAVDAGAAAGAGGEGVGAGAGAGVGADLKHRKPSQGRCFHEMFSLPQKS